MISNCKNGMCSHCGECCSDILHLDSTEINRIKEYIKENNIKPSNYRIIDNCKPTMDLGCPFRDDSLKICKIYKVRPDICKAFRCDYTKKDIEKNRDIINMNKLPRSLRLVFYNDDINQRLLKEMFRMDVFGNEPNQ